MATKTTIIAEMLLIIFCLPGCNKRIEENASLSGKKINFQYPSFTFVRIRYTDTSGNQSRCMTDYPDSDLNFSAKFEEATGLETNPNPVVLELTDPGLKNYPFIYVVEGGSMNLGARDVTNLRNYLLNGGFLMVDDFWGRDEWDNVYLQMKKVFPERELVRLNIEHELFNCFYQIDEKPQVPAINYAVSLPDDTLTGITSERPDAPNAEYYGIFDDNGRMMAILCRDTDLGDGWERAGVSKAYYEEFSLKKAYPMGINIVVYALTH